jgi:hypothetical protein
LFAPSRRYPTHKGPGLDAGHAKSLGEQKQINRFDAIDPELFKIQDATLATTKLSKNTKAVLAAGRILPCGESSTSLCQ